ncbi:MAG: hypothetical protein ACR2L2_13715 [Acidobacteriota bacterium]
MSPRNLQLPAETPVRPLTDEQLRDVYGPGIQISRVGRFNLIHLDTPSPELSSRRETEFDPDREFPDDCPICKRMKEAGCDVVYDDSDEDED